MPIVYITRRETFCASHRLHRDDLSTEQNHSLYGKCNRTNGHGHNYVLEVTLRGEIDPKTDMIINITELRDLMKDVLIEECDHHHLNLDCPMFKGINPTAENMVVVFYRLLEQKLPPGILYEVKLQETEKNTSRYRGE